ncbi:MAG: HD domain-containing protein [Clostridiales bacterium]|nr:HD domain-containing protein [Clostridiales bacterium]
MKASTTRISYALPEEVAEVISRLEEDGKEAYVVGGAVRDILMGKKPDDYDVTTSATPHEVSALFGQENCHPTGIVHGTVTVVINGMPVEVTTFRIDGDYEDGRHPNEVHFTRSLEEDVKRRDFTINALAMRLDGTVLDYCGGIEDIRNKCLRTVGEPSRRFREDALRILRALRFASERGFAIEKETSEEIFRRKNDLCSLSVERIWKEFSRLMLGSHCVPILREYFGVVAAILPEIVPMRGFLQHNPHHIYDVWEHTLVSIEHIPATPVLRMTMLLHDIGKPECFVMDDSGIGHFYGHQKVSADIADSILRRWKVDTKTRETIVLLIREHDAVLEPSLRIVRRRLLRYGEEVLRMLLEVKKADISAHSEKSAYRLPEISAFETILDQVVEEKMCCSYSAMAINGKDLMRMGIEPGIRIGQLKKQLLEEVVDGRIPNEREALLKRALELKEEM